MTAADAQLYQAKRAGGNRVAIAFEPPLRVLAARHPAPPGDVLTRL